MGIAHIMMQTEICMSSNNRTPRSLLCVGRYAQPGMVRGAEATISEIRNGLTNEEPCLYVGD